MPGKGRFAEAFILSGLAGILLSPAAFLLLGDIGGNYIALVLQPLFILGLWNRNPSVLLTVVSMLIVLATIFMVYGLGGLLLYRVWMFIHSRITILRH